MNTRISTLSVFALIVPVTLINTVEGAGPLGTAVTYQGQLKQNGAPANGDFDMEFRLFDAATLGNQVGNSVTVNGVDVSNGLFTVTLNAAGEFGPSAFNGERRWLQITVDGTTLAPRQPLIPVPYAIHALDAPHGHSLDAADGDPTDAVFVDSDGNVGIGTTSPTEQLDVNGAARTTSLEITGGSPPQYPLAGWGFNGYGQIDVPQDPFDTFTAIAAGAPHSLAIRSDGTLAGWGNSDFGETTVPAGTFTAIAAGYRHSLAIRTDRTLAGWGYNNYGQINVPAGTFIAVAAGYEFGLAIRSDGTLVGWGNNNFGETEVPAGTFSAVAVGSFHCLAIRDNGTLVGWGYNYYGQTDVSAGTFIAAAAGQTHSLAIRSDGTLIGLGNNGNGQINVPTGSFTAVAASGYHSLAIRGEKTPAFGLLLAADSAAKPGSNTWTIWSDRRLKKNIEPLSGALERLLQLHGVTFQWLDPASQGGITGTQMGLIADEVQRAFPQWVGRDPKGYQTLTVGGFEALTAEALRELRAEKNGEITELKDRLQRLEAMLERVNSKGEGERQ